MNYYIKNIGRFFHSALSYSSAGKISVAGSYDDVSQVLESLDISLCHRVFVHLCIHSRRYYFGAVAGKSCCCQHIVGDSRSKLGNAICCSRSYYQYISLISKGYMLNFPWMISVKSVCDASVVGESLEGKRCDELCGVLSHDNIYIGVLFDEL